MFDKRLRIVWGIPVLHHFSATDSFELSPSAAVGAAGVSSEAGSGAADEAALSGSVALAVVGAIGVDDDAGVTAAAGDATADAWLS